MTQDLQPGDGGPAVSNPNASRSWQVHYPFESLDMVWTVLESAHQAELVIVGSCGHVTGISRETYIDAGLSPSHCYSLVRVFEHQVSIDVKLTHGGRVRSGPNLGRSVLGRTEADFFQVNLISLILSHFLKMYNIDTLLHRSKFKRCNVSHHFARCRRNVRMFPAFL